MLHEKAQIYKITCLILETKIIINTIEYEHGSLLEFHLLLGQVGFFFYIMSIDSQLVDSIYY